MPLLSAVTREPASCGGPSLFNARALPDRGDPQVASQADYVSHLHLRCATHLPLARHLVTDSLPFPATSCTFNTPPWTLDVDLCSLFWAPILSEDFLGACSGAFLGRPHALLGVFGALSALRHVGQWGLGRT
jgi:hypothetical protein